MKIVRILSAIGLAGYLILQGLFYLGEQTSPLLNNAIGAIGVATGALILISLGHWVGSKKHK